MAPIDLKTTIKHYEATEKAANGPDALPTEDELKEFRDSIRAARVKFSKDQRKELRQMVTILRNKVPAMDEEVKNDFNKLHEELDETAADIARDAEKGIDDMTGGALTKVEKFGKDNLGGETGGKVAKYGVLAAAGAGIAYVGYKIWRGIVGAKNVAVGGAKAGAERVKGAGSFMGRWFKRIVIGGVLAAAGYGAYKYLEGGNATATPSLPDDARKATEALDNVRKALRTNGDVPAALAALKTLTVANPAMKDKFVNQEFVDATGKEQVLQCNPNNNEYILASKEVITNRITKARSQLSTATTAEAIAKVLTDNAGLPNNADTVEAFIAEFNNKVMVDGVAQLVRYDGVNKMFVLIGLDRRTKAVKDAQETLTKNYANISEWTTDLNKIVTENSADKGLAAEIVKVLAAGKVIGDKSYRAEVGAGGINVVEDKRLSTLPDGEKKGTDVKFEVMDGTNIIKGTLKLSGPDDGAMVLTIGTHSYNLITPFKNAIKQSLLTSAKKNGNALEITGQYLFASRTYAISLSEMEKMIITVSRKSNDGEVMVPLAVEKIEGGNRKPDTLNMTLSEV